MSINLEDNRTQKIAGQISVEGVPWVFVQGLTAVFDTNLFARDFIGTGKSVFTQGGDVIGTFNFNLKNTVDVWKVGTAGPTDAVELVGTWIEAIAARKPVSVSFIQTFVAPEATGGINDRIRVTFDGRIMKPELSWLVDVAVDDVIVDGEITGLTSAIRDTNP